MLIDTCYFQQPFGFLIECVCEFEERVVMKKLRFFKLGLIPQTFFLFSINVFCVVKAIDDVKAQCFHAGRMPQAFFVYNEHNPTINKTHSGHNGKKGPTRTRTTGIRQTNNQSLLLPNSELVNLVLDPPSLNIEHSHEIQQFLLLILDRSQLAIQFLDSLLVINPNVGDDTCCTLR